MAASDNLSRQQFYHGTYGYNELKPGDYITPGAQPTRVGGYSKHAYYTSDLESAAKTYAGFSQPRKPNGLADFDAPAVPGRVYAVQPETASGRKVTRHSEDPYSGAPGNLNAYRTRGRLRVLHEVDKQTGEPLDPEARA